MHLACQKKRNQSIVLRLTSASVLIRTRGWARPSSSGWCSWPTATPRHWSVRGRSSSPTTFPATASGAAETKKYFNRWCHLIFMRNSNVICFPHTKKYWTILKRLNNCFFLYGVRLPGNREPPVANEGHAQCVELALRWQFCVHGSICHEICF